MSGEQLVPSQAVIEEQLANAHLEPMQSFFAFPSRYRRHVLRNLELAGGTIPTADESDAARRAGGSTYIPIERRYGDAADAFARDIYPNFDRLIIDDNYENLEAIRLRGEFYRMIRTLVAEQVQEGVRILRQIEPALQRQTT